MDYDRLADGYDQRCRANALAGVERALAGVVAGLRPELSLEVGCGSGRWLPVLEGEPAGGRPTETPRRAVGLDPSRCTDARRNDIDAFIELHIEQGPVLEQAGVPVAIVTGITAIRGTLVEIEGVANHAGAFPMHLRHDPMDAFAEIATGVIGEARRMGPPAVTTIGRVEVAPNLSTIIPARVSR